MRLQRIFRLPRPGIRGKYLLTYTLTIALPILLFLWLLFGYISGTILSQTLENTRQSNLQFKTNLTVVIKSYLDIANQLCYSGEIQQLVEADDSKILQELPAYLSMKDAILNSILFYDYQIIPKIHLLEDSAMIDHQFFVPLERDAGEWRLYQALLHTETADWSCANDKITISRPFTNYIKKPLGLVQVTVREQELYRQMEPYDPTERKIVIFDGAGTVVTSNDRMLVGTDISDAEYFLRWGEDAPVYIGDRACAVLYESLATEPNYPDWTIATIVPVGAIDRLSTRVVTMGGILIAVCFLFSSGVYLLLSGSIVRRIRLLSARMQDVGRTMFVQIAEDGPRDEISMVIRAFNDMSASLEQVIYDNYLSQLKLSKITIEKQNAELYALQNQMHPHFLFNTLESIRMKLQNRDNSRAQDMLVSLSKILRLSLASGEDLIPLRAELEYVGHYVQIQAARFPARFRFRLDLPEELGGCRIPKYAVQTMVENAIIHGIEPKGTPGCISVHVRRSGGDVRVTIEDDGVGMPQERLESVLRRLEAPPEQMETTNIGIKNVRDRLLLHFGPAYGVGITSRAGTGTVVELLIPFE